MGLRNEFKDIMPNGLMNVYSKFHKIVNDEQNRLTNLDKEVFKKVKEVDTNKQTVFNSFVKKETP